MELFFDALNISILFVCFSIILSYGLVFSLAYWVLKDAQKRGDDNAAIWAFGVVLFTVVTLVLYFIFRPSEVAEKKPSVGYRNTKYGTKSKVTNPDDIQGEVIVEQRDGQTPPVTQNG